MFFKDITGHTAVKQRLIKSVQDQRISHAQLFFGPGGTGALPLAIAYARYINCTDRGEEDACGLCPSCQKFTKLAHPDLHFVFPVVNLKGSTSPTSDQFISQWRESLAEHPYMTENQWYMSLEAENKQGYISRNESNEVLRKLSLKSYEAEYKVMVMWLAEKMHPAAANSLLKLLEEPPDKTLFLLISENTDAILTTILSRTQMIRLNPLRDEEVIAGLLERYPEKEELAADVARRSAGNFSAALEMMEVDEETDEFLEQFIYFMRKCYGREIVDLQKWVETVASWGRERLKHFLSYSLQMIRENFMLNLKQEKITHLSKKEAAFSSRFSAFIHQGNVYDMAREFEEAARHIEANGMAKLILLDLAIKNILLLKMKVPE